MATPKKTQTINQAGSWERKNDKWERIGKEHNLWSARGSVG